MNEYIIKTDPLGLPPGSVRALIAILAVVGAIMLSMFGKSIPDFLMTLLPLIVGYYFGMRTNGSNGK